MSETTSGFVQSLVEQFPSLQAMFDEHQADHEGDVLAHVFFIDVTRHALELHLTESAAPNAPTESELSRLLGFLENTFASGNPELQELIVVSFLENLPRDDEPGAGICRALGPNLAKQLEAFG